MTADDDDALILAVRAVTCAACGLHVNLHPHTKRPVCLVYVPRETP